MKRRGIALIPVAAALAGLSSPGSLRAQATRAKRLGVLTIVLPTDPEYLHGEMRARGWNVGRDLIVIRRIAEGDPSRLPALARELIAEDVDVILANGDAPAVAAASATSMIPVVMQGLAPVESGLAASLARPGKNVTGVVYLAQDYVGKYLELLHSLQPGLKRIGLMGASMGEARRIYVGRWQELAGAVGISVIPLPPVHVLAELDKTLAIAEQERVQALVVGPLHALRGAGWQHIRLWAVRNRVVTASPPEFRAAALGFGTSMEHFNKLWFDLLDRVLRGANPAETPIQQPTNFEVVIDRGHLRQMGLTVSRSVLAQATEVID